jgi:hypothetical protein
MHNLFSKRGCPDVVNDRAAQLSLYHHGALDGNALETFNLVYSLHYVVYGPFRTQAKELRVLARD